MAKKMLYVYLDDGASTYKGIMSAKDYDELIKSGQFQSFSLDARDLTKILKNLKAGKVEWTKEDFDLSND